MKSLVAVAVLLVVGLWLRSATAAVIILRNDFTVSLQSLEATFAKPIGKYGVSGYLVSSIPLNACSSIIPPKPHPIATLSPFALISGGEQCSLTVKVQNAQQAGFAGAIIFDDAAPSQFITTVGGGPTEEVGIYVMFVSKSGGAILQQYVEGTTAEIWILPVLDDSLWPSVCMTLISFLGLSVIPLAFLLINRNRLSPNNSGSNGDPEASVNGCFKMRVEEVRALPIVIFTGLTNGRVIDGTCAVCLEDYLHGERLRVLPCFHRFHTSCIDAWLTMWKPLCPLCRCDPRPNSLSSSETTPLLAPQQPTLQQSQQPFAYGTTDIEASLHSPPMQIPDAINSHFQSMVVPPNPQTHANNASPVFATSHVSVNSPFHSQADSSLEAFRTSPHFISPHYLSTYLSPSAVR